MDRLELIRGIVDKEIGKLQNEEERKFAYIHTYGVAQAAAFLAKKRKLNMELACISAMLHDISIYAMNCPHAVHAQESAKFAKKILEETKEFSEDEITIITHVIAVHSNKTERHDGPISELLKDADVAQHYFYNTNIPLAQKDNYRLFYLLEELDNHCGDKKS